MQEKEEKNSGKELPKEKQHQKNEKNIKKPRKEMASSGGSKYKKLCRPLNINGNQMQACIDRLNEVFGLTSWGYAFHIQDHRACKTHNGAIHETTVLLGIWLVDKDNLRSAISGSYAPTYAQALDLSIHDAFVKAAASWGVGSSMIKKIESFEFDDKQAMFEETIKGKTETFHKSKDLLLDDGAPPSNPNGMMTDEQKQKLLSIIKKLNRPQQEYIQFISTNPTYARAQAILDNLSSMLSPNTMGGL